MRAIVFHQYGDPKDVMELIHDREVPRPNADEVLVKVECSSINAADRYMVRADYLIIRLLLGLFGPARKHKVLGMDIAGTIQAIGERVEGFQVGDPVAADIRKSLGGGFGEYATVRAGRFSQKAGRSFFRRSATVPISGQAAMMGLIHCSIEPGDRILINGASGGVGSFGVQIAKSLGAHVTARCSTAKFDEVKSWGADETVDYKATSIRDLKRTCLMPCLILPASAALAVLQRSCGTMVDTY